MSKRIIGKKVLSFSTLSSTMVKARELADKGAAEGTVVITYKQTAGRGRMGRNWLTPDGNIAASIVLYPDIRQLPEVIMISSLAVARSIETIFGLETELKWPNDIMVKGRKIAGILMESVLNEGKVEYVIIGLGINVNLRIAEYPVIAEIATSLSEEIGSEIRKGKLMVNLLNELDNLYRSLQRRDIAIFSEWRRRLGMLGKRVKVVQDSTVLVGLAQDVERNGSLIVILEDGSMKQVLAGDVSLSITN